MADAQIQTGEDKTTNTTAVSPPTFTAFLGRILSKRRTWVALFVLAYTLLLSSSWKLIRSILSWYSTTTGSDSAASSAAVEWPALYASVLFGAIFGLLSMAAAFAIAVPATVVTWITVLVLLAFSGRPRKSLVAEGRKITADIISCVFKIVLKEGNLVAAACAILSFLALVRRGEED